eukprot:g2734.t2
MMFENALSNESSPIGGRAKTAVELREAVSLASDSLNKLNGKFQFTRHGDVSTSLSYQHIRVQETQGKRRTKLASQDSLTTCENNIGMCLDLLERLERAEELALKIKNLRDNVERISQRLK